MVFFQVEDVNLKFVELEELEAKNWITDEKSKTKIAVVKKPKNVSKPFKPKAKVSSNLRAFSTSSDVASETLVRPRSLATPTVSQLFRKSSKKFGSVQASMKLPRPSSLHVPRITSTLVLN